MSEETLEPRMRTAEAKIERLEAGHKGHEDLCAERYDRIKEGMKSVGDRMKRVELWIIGAAGSSVLVLVKALLDVVTRQ